MLRSLDAILGFEAHGPQNRLGIVRDVRFDNRSWAIDHFVIATPRTSGSDVLLGVDSLLRIDVQAKRVLFEVAASGADTSVTGEHTALDLACCPHLLRTHELCGYLIAAHGSQGGHIDDYIIDDQTWTIRYLVIESGIWGQTTWLVAPPTAIRMDWKARRGLLRTHRSTERRLA